MIFPTLGCRHAKQGCVFVCQQYELELSTLHQQLSATQTALDDVTSQLSHEKSLSHRQHNDWQRRLGEAEHRHRHREAELTDRHKNREAELMAELGRAKQRETELMAELGQVRQREADVTFELTQQRNRASEMSIELARAKRHDSETNEELHRLTHK